VLPGAVTLAACSDFIVPAARCAGSRAGTGSGRACLVGDGEVVLDGGPPLWSSPWTFSRLASTSSRAAMVCKRRRVGPV